jgi:hypothetical protein
MKVLINGCSHTAMDYINWFDKKNKIFHQPINRPSWVSYLNTKLKTKHLANIHTNPVNFPNKDKKDYIREYTLLDIVKDSSFILSLATDGKGNDSIFFDTLSTLRYCKKKNIKIDYVCIQWSGHSRRLVTSDKGDLDFANPHENYEFGINLEPSGSFITLQYMVLLQNYLNENNINYNFLNYFPLDKRVIQNNTRLYRELDKSKFLSYKKHHPIVGAWIDNIKNDNLALDEDGHPGPKLQKLISDKVFKNIVKYKKKIQ